MDVLPSIGNILCFPFSTDTLDKTGNHTIDDGTPTLLSVDGSTHYTYDGNDMLRVNTTATEAPRIIASTQAHQIPHSSPVSFGMFMYARSWGGGTPQLMISGAGGNNGNYGIQRQVSAGWRHQGTGVSNLGDQRNLTPTGKWFHWALVIDSTARGAGGNAAEFYLNGVAVFSGTVGAGDTVSATDDFSFISDSDESTAGWNGFVCNCFVTDTVLDAATIKALSDESFGHASPYMPPAP